MKYNIAAPYFPEEDIEGIVETIKGILRGNGMLSMGENVSKFEAEFSSYVGSKYAVATNSCTSALEIALKAIGVKVGDEVIVPVQTFIATGSSVVKCNAIPVFCEINENFVIDFKCLKEKITEKTKAVIMVHFTGLIHSKILEIRDYLKEKNIYLIEDAAHAHGAKIDNVYAGNIGDLGCFSFYSTKIITMGEGGIITTNNEDLYRICNSLRHRGLDINAGFEIYSNIGSNNRLTEFQALLGLYQLKRLDSFVEHRNHLAKIYMNVLSPLYDKGKIHFQLVPHNAKHAYWRFIVIMADDVDRRNIQQKMLEKGIKVDFPYTPLLHLQPIFKRIYNTKAGMFPYSEKLSRQHICLPMHLEISLQDAEFIAYKLFELIK